MKREVYAEILQDEAKAFTKFTAAALQSFLPILYGGNDEVARGFFLDTDPANLTAREAVCRRAFEIGTIMMDNLYQSAGKTHELNERNRQLTRELQQAKMILDLKIKAHSQLAVEYAILLRAEGRPDPDLEKQIRLDLEGAEPVVIQQLSPDVLDVLERYREDGEQTTAELVLVMDETIGNLKKLLTKGDEK